MATVDLKDIKPGNARPWLSSLKPLKCAQEYTSAAKNESVIACRREGIGRFTFLFIRTDWGVKGGCLPPLPLKSTYEVGFAFLCYVNGTLLDESTTCSWTLHITIIFISSCDDVFSLQEECFTQRPSCLICVVKIIWRSEFQHYCIGVVATVAHRKVFALHDLSKSW